MDKKILTRMFHALLTEYNLHEQKYALLEGFGATSTTDLTSKQLLELCNMIRNNAAQERDRKLKDKRSLCLRLLTDIGVYYVAPGEANKACWGRVNEFVKQPKIAGKIFYNLTVKDLDNLAIKLRALKSQGYYKGVEKPVQEVKTVITIPLNLDTPYMA